MKKLSDIDTKTVYDKIQHSILKHNTDNIIVKLEKVSDITHDSELQFQIRLAILNYYQQKE